MNKTISKLVALGFAVLIALGLATNLFLTVSVQRSIAKAQYIEDTAVEARAATRSLRADYLEMGSALGTALLNPAIKANFRGFWAQNSKLEANADKHLQTALEHTRSPELRVLLRELEAHDKTVNEPLEQQLEKLVNTDVTQARRFYMTQYLPAERENIRIAEAALSVATQHVSALKEDVETQAEFALSIARRAILLFVVLSLASGFFLTRFLSSIVRKWEQVARANQNMLEYSQDIICSIDGAGRFVEVSPVCQQVWGYSSKELNGRFFRELVHPDGIAKTVETVSGIISGIPVKDFENRYVCKNGSVVDMLWSAHWSGTEQFMFCVARDITERKEAQEKLRVLSMYDGLTNLLNRRAIVEHLTGEMERARREKQSLSVVLLDLDHFKQINDLHGHAAGDAVLTETARRMKNSMRGYDKVGRYGGEEFLIVAPGCGEQDSVVLAERVRRCIIGEGVQTPQGPLSVTCSLGAAVMWAGSHEWADALIARADSALYRAKASGRNRTELAETPQEIAILPTTIAD